MKKKILFSILFSLLGLSLLLFVFVRTGYIYIGISPYYNYKLNETETKLFEDAISKLRERVELGKFDEIEANIADGPVSKTEIIEKLKKSRRKFGKPIFSEFFRSSPPDSASKYYPNVNGTDYITFYFTNTDDDDFFSEHFEWIVTENNEVKLLNYDGNHIRDWELQTRELERRLKEYKHEINIPYGERFIEIKY